MSQQTGIGLMAPPRHMLTSTVNPTRDATAFDVAVDGFRGWLQAQLQLHRRVEPKCSAISARDSAYSRPELAPSPPDVKPHWCRPRYG